MNTKLTMWFTAILCVAAVLAGMASGRRSVMRKMRRGEITSGACGLIALLLIAALTLGIVVGERVGRKVDAAAHALDVAVLQANNAALLDEVASYRATMDAIGIGPQLGKRINPRSIDIGKPGKGDRP